MGGHAFGLALLLVVLVPTSAVHAAASLVVRPTRVVITEDQDIVAITVDNQGDTETAIQMQLMKWSQRDGEDVYEPSDDMGLMACPPLFVVGAGSTQIVRVGLEQDRKNWNSEEAYRLFIQEIPPEPAEGETGVQVALRIGVPVFLPPKDFSQPNLTWHMESRGAAGLWMTVSNSGTVHALVSGVQLSSRSGFRFAASAHQYVLPGATMSWRLDGLNPISGPLPDTVEFQISTDQGLYEGSLPIGK